MSGTMAPMEGADWAVGTWICSHWLCGPLVCHLLMECPKEWFLPPLTPPTLPRPTPSPTAHPTYPSIINTDGRKRQQKYHEIQPSEIEEVSYNKKQ